MTTANFVVFAHLPGQVEAVPAGMLQMNEEGSNTLSSTFAYGRRYRERPNRVPVDPISLSLPNGGDPSATMSPTNGLLLFGAIRDATPDLWGRRVIENKLGVSGSTLPESVYLAHAGSNRPGALDIRGAVDAQATQGALLSVMDLEHLVDAADRIEAGEPVPTHLQLIFEGGPSLGGARPKALLRHKGREWVAKFPIKSDRFDVPMIERCSLELARKAGMDVPETDVIKLADRRSVMLIERFDRVPGASGQTRIHMVSGLTMLGLEENEYTGSYAQLCEALERHGSAGQVGKGREELFRRMVFNILVGNDDDHLRNHAFLFDGHGWNLSKLYDVVPKPQVGMTRHQHLAVGREGRLSTLDNALSSCERFGLTKPVAAELISHVASVAREWRQYFESVGATAAQCDAVQSAFRRPRDIGLEKVEARL